MYAIGMSDSARPGSTTSETLPHRPMGKKCVCTLNAAKRSDAVTKLGSEEAAAVLSAEFLAILPGLFSRDVDEAVRAVDSLLHLCFVRQPEASDLYTMLGFNVSVPPFVRQALLTRVVDNDDLLPTIGKPVVITHGALDAIVSQEAVAQHRACLAHAQVDIMPDAGHAPFWDDAERFNRRLGAFCEEVASSGAEHAPVRTSPASRTAPLR